MKKKTLFVFNPETDYALAVGNRFYQPPASVVTLRKNLALLPSVYSQLEDMILVLDKLTADDIEKSPFNKYVFQKNLKIISLEDLPGVIGEYSLIKPWGWNMTIRKTLLSNGADESKIPSEKFIERLRCLSHRRNSIIFQKTLNSILPFEVPVAQEFFSLEGVKQFIEQHGDAYIKAPWSSSGRGVVKASSLSSDSLEKWVNGIINRQGSLTVERAFERILDFATEWEAIDGEIIFKGLSLFKTSSEGRYLNNKPFGQHLIEKEIKNHTYLWDNGILEIQKQVLKSMFASDYTGPLGIDMLIDKDGFLNPCVEINLRMTMGHVSLAMNH